LEVAVKAAGRRERAKAISSSGGVAGSFLQCEGYFKRETREEKIIQKGQQRQRQDIRQSKKRAQHTKSPDKIDNKNKTLTTRDKCIMVVK
jgi:hypothetical protein